MHAYMHAGGREGMKESRKNCSGSQLLSYSPCMQGLDIVLARHATMQLSDCMPAYVMMGGH